MYDALATANQQQIIHANCLSESGRDVQLLYVYVAEMHSKRRLLMKSFTSRTLCIRILSTQTS